MIMGSAVFILALLVFLSAFFSLSETALVSLSPQKTKVLALQRPQLSKELSRWLTRPQELLILIVIGNTLVNVCFATLVTVLAFRVFPGLSESQVEIFVCIFGTILLFLVGELVPKLVARTQPEKISLFVLPWLSTLRTLFKPVVRLFSTSVRPLLKSTMLSQTSPSLAFSIEELKAFLEEEENQGSQSARESVNMMQRALELHDRSLESIMTKLDQMDVIEIDPLGKPVRSRDLLLDLIIEQGHTRTPVKKWGRIMGFIHSKDLLSLILKDPGTDLTTLVRPVVDLRAEMRVGDLLRLFKEKGFHMGFVYNRQGQIVGMVTLEDVMEEITGEILDEYDVAVPTQEKE